MTKGSAFVPHDLAAPIKGGDGPLTGLTAVVKDMYDIAGDVTGGGNPQWLAAHRPAAKNADAVAMLLAAGATITGKTVCDEFFYSITGINAHYGAPVNPRSPGRIPGGSSSGSAAAVAAGAADIGLGSDTGGSVRIPAALNGIYGIRPTTGRVSLGGAMAMAATFDTAGWFTAGPGLLRKLGGIMLQGAAVRATVTRLLIPDDVLGLAHQPVVEGFQRFFDRAAPSLPSSSNVTVAPHGFDQWRETFRTIQAFETWAIYGAWLEGHDARLGPGTAERMAYAKTVSAQSTAAAREVLDGLRTHIRGLVPAGTVLLMPTGPALAVKVTASAEELNDFRTRTMAFTCIAGLGGLPQVTLPAANAEGCAVGVSLMGWPGADETLLDLAVALSRHCGD
jgi:amidase